MRLPSAGWGKDARHLPADGSTAALPSILVAAAVLDAIRPFQPEGAFCLAAWARRG